MKSSNVAYNLHGLGNAAAKLKRAHAAQAFTPENAAIVTLFVPAIIRIEEQGKAIRGAATAGAARAARRTNALPPRRQ